MPSTRTLACLATALVLAGCSTPSMLRNVPVQQRFRHIDERQAHALSDENLKSMRFYVERNVLAVGLERTGLTAGSGGKMLVRQVDPGTVVDVGPDWLRVKFAGGTGVFFLTKGTNDDQYYHLATEIEGREGLHVVKDMAEPSVRYEGHSYPITQGADTLLRVDVEDLREVVKTRTIDQDD